MTFVNASDQGLANEAKSAQTGLRNNPHYPDPKPSLNEFEILYNNYIQKYEAARSRDRIKIAEKNEAKSALIASMRELSNYVNMASKNVRSILLSSGFTISKNVPEPNVLGPITDFTVGSGLNKGDIMVSCKSVKNAVSYIFKCSDTEPDNNTIWRMNTTTSSKSNFDNLTKGVEYYFIVEAIGRNNQSLSSSPVSLISQ